jgi:hypothetical protein
MGALWGADRTRRGAIMVFWRQSRESGKGHVGYTVAKTAVPAES